MSILDLSRGTRGPYCTMILGDPGADVIKVEHPSCDETRGPGVPSWQARHVLPGCQSKHARRMVKAATHPTIGKVRLPGIPFEFSDMLASIHRHPPLLGEHTVGIRLQYANAAAR